MKRKRIVLFCQYLAATSLVVTPLGCASLQDSASSIVRAEATNNPAKASRLTGAGIKALKVGATDEAARKFLQAIAVDETFGPAYNNLGLLRYEQGNLYEAVLSFEQAMDLLPGDPTVYYNLGLALESAGKTAEAMDLYQQAVEIDPTNPNFLGNLVRLRVRLGEQNPSLVRQLQDLILIETRPQWRSWADEQLALHLNDALDRGPAAPDFRPDTKRDPSAKSGQVIDLTPPTTAEPETVPGEPSSSTPRILSGPGSESADAQPLPEPATDASGLQLEDPNQLPDSSEYFR